MHPVFVFLYKIAKKKNTNTVDMSLHGQLSHHFSFWDNMS